ncbi:MAG: response regulator transcription factor [Atopobiaceae bacterium]|jgi:DNA-binding response OmpR family regulator
MRVLLAEDETGLRRALVAILEHAGYTVDAAPDGEEALYFAFNNHYDVVVLDIMMPKVDGLTVLKRLRDEHNAVPVIMLTAKSEVRDRVEGLDSGANDYLTKPFAAAELLARLRALTRVDVLATAGEISFGDVTLDLEASTLSRGDKRVDLTAREREMMEVLMRHPAKRISVDQFMRSVWGMESDVEQSVVWVNISTLRKKLAQLESAVRIDAIRGVGYTLVDGVDGASGNATNPAGDVS